MAKVIKGTKDRRNHQVLKGQTDIRQIRCTKCHTGLATQVPDGKGGHVYSCPSCGGKFNFVKM